MIGARKPLPHELEIHRAAARARENAYVPASQFRVGAAVSIAGETVTGANFENDSFGLTICAERGAIGAAIAQGLVARAIEEGADPKAPACLDVVAVAGAANTVSPCGACRQVIAQFAGPETRIVYPSGGALVSVRFIDLLPDPFKL